MSERLGLKRHDPPASGTFNVALANPPTRPAALASPSAYSLLPLLKRQLP
jgi:hypothetical protein